MKFFLIFQVVLYFSGNTAKCLLDNGVSQTCMPPSENIAFHRIIKTNSTCGLKKKQEFCITGRYNVKNECKFCEAKEVNIDLVTDMEYTTKPSFWQSESLYESNHPVFLTLDLNKKYIVQYIKIRFQSMRPSSLAIYKKSTHELKENWLPYQYYSRTCKQSYGLPASNFNSKVTALCSDKSSDIFPLTKGVVNYAPLRRRPGSWNFDQNEVLQDWVTVTSLKFSLDQMNTFGDEVFGDPKVMKSYYYAISDITVGGRCKCNGHADKCTKDSEGVYQCECQHNTTGRDCEKCLPLYQRRPWKRATRINANQCIQ